ncbi:MAG: prepilin-type N-terminal cleavage/methylation domain-containing protein [Desulfobulbaceae bacterium]|nr:prepilin-type N-terminal cleavage/methylation domain-containing protein [Desulfobulbaceae bacterium]
MWRRTIRPVARPLSLVDKKQGFTLVELMVGLVLSSIVMVGIYRGFVGLITANETQEQMVEINQNLRVGLQTMTDDIRMAGYNPTLNAASAMLDASTAAICTFTMDEDADGTAETTILYQVVGGVLQRVENGTARPLINNVDALDFGYLDDAGVAVTPSQVRQVQVSIVVRSTNEDYEFTDAGIYENLQGVVILPAQNDHFHRRVESIEIKCRNIGA